MRLAVCVPRQAFWKLAVPGGTCPPLGDFSDATLGCWFCRRVLQGFWWCFKGGIVGVPWVVAWNVSLELWLGI